MSIATERNMKILVALLVCSSDTQALMAEAERSVTVAKGAGGEMANG